jgi:hypothetical protein
MSHNVGNMPVQRSEDITGRNENMKARGGQVVSGGF